MVAVVELAVPADRVLAVEPADRVLVVEPAAAVAVELVVAVELLAVPPLEAHRLLQELLLPAVAELVSVAELAVAADRAVAAATWRPTPARCRRQRLSSRVSVLPVVVALAVLVALAAHRVPELLRLAELPPQQALLLPVVHRLLLHRSPSQ